jgi:hypothetical protein
MPGADERVQTLRLDLHAAQQAWSEGRREEARARVLRTYRDQFEPMERSLRSLDPVATLELEYAFGDLERRMRRNSDALGLAQAVQRITRGTDELVAALPAAPADPTAAPVPSAAAPTAEAAPLPAHLRSGEGG